MTIFSSDDDIERIGRGLLDRTLPKPDWTHAAHFAAALWLLRHRPGLVAQGQVGAIIRAYNVATGGVNDDQGGYHETITVASMRAAAGFLRRYPGETPLWHIADDLVASPLGQPGWLPDYWSRPRLFSVAARRDWLAPDLRPFPW